MSVEELKNKLRTLFAGRKTDLVIDRIAKTFKALCEYGDFSISENVATLTPSQVIQEPPHTNTGANPSKTMIADAHKPAQEKIGFRSSVPHEYRSTGHSGSGRL
jgi:hypothetical protein